MPNEARTYTIAEASTLSGLASSTLRYYESIGLIQPIERNESSKQRAYTEDDVNTLVAIACLNATGLSIEDMKKYLANRDRGSEGANEQIELLSAKQSHLEGEIHFMQLRLDYIKNKISFWHAVGRGDEEAIERARNSTFAAADKMKLSKTV